MSRKSESEQAILIHRVTGKVAQDIDDYVAVEEPMEIRIAYGDDASRSSRSLSVTMRTPGEDFELAAGFLFTEGLLTRSDQIRRIEFCGPPAPGRPTSNIVRVELAPEVEVDLGRLQRNFFTSSSCGICGKASLDALHVQGVETVQSDTPLLRRSLIPLLPERLHTDQPGFHRTGGLHAAGVFDSDGVQLVVREDVGRHNAVDKVLGRRFLDGALVHDNSVMVVSGRASFEILQKALVARLPVLVAVGAPSSLAVEMAEKFGMTLIGFTGRDRFNVYAGKHRIIDG